MRLVRILGLFFSLAVLPVLFGCGSQDRYQVVAPGAAMVVSETDWAALTDVQGFFNHYDYPLATEWQGDLVLGAYDQLIYRVLPEGYEPFPSLPADFHMRGLVEGPDGNLWVGGIDGRVLSFENGQWVTEVSLDTEYNINGMLVDHLGRVMVFGSQSELWRRESSGQWVRQELPEVRVLVRSWCEHGAPPVFISASGHLLQEEDGQWQFIDVPQETFFFDYPQYAASEDGHRVYVTPYLNSFLLDEGEGWVSHDLGMPVRHMFWTGGELYGLFDSSYEIFQWDNGTWVVVEELAGSSLYGTWSFPRDGQRQLILDDGANVLFDGVSLSASSPPVGSCRGLGEFNGQDHVFVSRGMFLKMENGIWRSLGYPFLDNDYVSNTYPWLVDDENQVVFLGREEVVRWNGQDYQRFPLADRVIRVFPQPDRSVILVTDQKIGLWAGGDIHWLWQHGSNPYNIVGCVLNPDGGVWVLNESSLTLVEAETSTMVMTFQGWGASRIINAPDHGLVICGDHRLIVVNDGSVSDFSPLWRANNELVAGNINNIALDGMGGWLAYDSRRKTLLRFDGQSWQGLDYNFWYEFGSSGSIVETGMGSFVLNYGSDIFRLEINP